MTDGRAAPPRSFRVLLVEDNPMSRQLAREILLHRGHTVAEAATLEEARRTVRAQSPHVAVVDIQLPDGSGNMLLREMRSDSALAGIPVVAVTAFAMRGDRELLLAEGFDEYVSKPIDTRSFADLVERLAAHGRPQTKA